jgi:hypothetical protein
LNEMHELVDDARPCGTRRIDDGMVIDSWEFDEAVRERECAADFDRDNVVEGAVNKDARHVCGSPGRIGGGVPIRHFVRCAA